MAFVDDEDVLGQDLELGRRRRRHLGCDVKPGAEPAAGRVRLGRDDIVPERGKPAPGPAHGGAARPEGAQSFGLERRGDPAKGGVGRDGHRGDVRAALEDRRVGMGERGREDDLGQPRAAIEDPLSDVGEPGRREGDLGQPRAAVEGRPFDPGEPGREGELGQRLQPTWVSGGKNRGSLVSEKAQNKALQ